MTEIQPSNRCGEHFVCPDDSIVHTCTLAAAHSGNHGEVLMVVDTGERRDVLASSKDSMMHVLRNPHGHSEQDVREARLWAGDEIERLQADLIETKNQRNDECRLRQAAERYAADLERRLAWKGFCECVWNDTRDKVVTVHPACRFHKAAPETPRRPPGDLSGVPGAD